MVSAVVISSAIVIIRYCDTNAFINRVNMSDRHCTFFLNSGNPLASCIHVFWLTLNLLSWHRIGDVDGDDDGATCLLRLT